MASDQLTRRDVGKKKRVRLFDTLEKLHEMGTNWQTEGLLDQSGPRVYLVKIWMPKTSFLKFYSNR